MAKQIARLLKTDVMADLDLPGLAQLLASQGRKGDTMLAHITPKEAALLRAEGGAGTTNPNTGLPEFYDDSTYFSPSRAGSVDVDTSTYYSPRSSATSAGPTDFGFERVSTYTPAGNQYDLMQAGGTPDIRTGGYRAPAVSSAYTGAVSPPNISGVGDATGSLSLYQARPGGVGLRAPVAGAGEGISLQQAQAAAPSAPYTPGAFTTIPEVQQALTREPGMMERLTANLTSPQTLEKLGVAGLQSLPAIIAARQASAQGRQAREEMQRMAAPYQQQGQQLVAQAQRGELTAPAQQQIQALQARAAQGVAGRGGVGAEQAAAQVEAFRQQLLQNQYDMGLKVANIGDQIAAGAIRTGLQADQYVNELTNNYFSTLARTMGGQAPFTQTQQPR